jgi:hypothetical protein
VRKCVATLCRTMPWPSQK